MELDKVLRERRSVRKYSNKEVPLAKVASLASIARSMHSLYSFSSFRKY